MLNLPWHFDFSHTGYLGNGFVFFLPYPDPNFDKERIRYGSVLVFYGSGSSLNFEYRPGFSHPILIVPVFWFDARKKPFEIRV